jgi:hypothetical protein
MTQNQQQNAKIGLHFSVVIFLDLLGSLIPALLSV